VPEFAPVIGTLRGLLTAAPVTVFTGTEYVFVVALAFVTVTKIVSVTVAIVYPYVGVVSFVGIVPEVGAKLNAPSP